ncbi:uncharacterized protein LOC112093861 [Morus notabilis]|uniref:uncharacterized protein LOC112093861 n=1 Tax=Morus notabilis TaxID=981085 RepID=UPI000CED47B3|nr:uncharacterized protein LOC112093861 [Morus notabilis]
MEENEEEYDTSQPQVGEGYIVGGTSQSLDGEESFLRTMRGPLNSSGRPLNIASSSRPILKRPSKSGGRLIDPEAKSVLKSIATTLKSRQNSRGTSSGASQPVATPNTTFKQCQQIIGEMSLDDEQIVCFVEYLNWNPNCQALFLCLNESQRLVYALKTLKSLANQPSPSLQPQFSFFMNPAAPFMGSQAYFMPPQQNFPHQHAPFPQRGPNFNPQPPTFQQPTPNFQQPAPNFQHSPQYYMGSQFPNFPRQFGGKGSDNVV